MSRSDRSRDPGAERTVVERVDPLIGSVLDQRFRIDFRLAAGGFGAIYRATHVKSGHQVALKVLHTELAVSDPKVIARFRREGATLEQLRSPHTITAYELGEGRDGTLYIVMELLHGESLYEQFRARGPFPWQRVIKIGRQICTSLAEAHALGIVHRDLKPANIHLEKRDGEDDFVKVLDFGIAKIIRDGEIEHGELTQAGQMIGTFDYMAPEQMVGGECTAATDIYTLGVLMYEMIAGVRPFHEAQTPTSMLASLLTQDAPSLGTHAEIPPELDRIMRKCLEREPQNRYTDVGDLAADLDELIRPARKAQTTSINTTPPPHPDEPTVIDTRRSPPNERRIALAPTQPVPARPTPQVARRPGSSPMGTPDPDQQRRPSAHVIPRKRSDSSQPPFDASRVHRDGSQPPFDPRARRKSTPTPHPAATPPPTPKTPTPTPITPTPVRAMTDEGWTDAKPTDPRQPWLEQSTDPRPAWHDSAPTHLQPAWQDSMPTDPFGRRDPAITPSAAPPRGAMATIPLKVAPPPAPAPGLHDPMRPSNPVMMNAPLVPPAMHPPYAQPTPEPHVPRPPLAIPQPLAQPPAYPAPGTRPSTPTDQRISAPGSMWQTPGYPPVPSARSGGTEVPGYDMGGAHMREVAIRRIVWISVIVIAAILAIVVASQL